MQRFKDIWNAQSDLECQTVWIQIRPDTNLDCLQRLSADNKSHQMFVWFDSLQWSFSYNSSVKFHDKDIGKPQHERVCYKVIALYCVSSILAKPSLRFINR